MEDVETSRRLSAISERLTKVLSSGGASHLDLFNAFDELRTIESEHLHRRIAEQNFIPLLLTFLTSANTNLFRRWAGAIIARVCHKSAAVAGLFSKFALRDNYYHLSYGIGNLILEEGRHEDLRLICGLIIRNCVFHGVDHRIFWPKHETPASFPIDYGQQWIDQFYKFTYAFDGFQLERSSSKGYPLSAVKGQPEFPLQGQPLQRLIEVSRGVAVIGLHLDISHVQFLDIPISRNFAFEKESEEIKLHFEGNASLLINSAASEAQELTLNFVTAEVANAALRVIEEAHDHSEIPKAAYSQQRFSTTEALNVSAATSTPHRQPPVMAQATDKLARLRAKGQPQNPKGASRDPDPKKSIKPKAATQPIPTSKPMTETQSSQDPYDISPDGEASMAEYGQELEYSQFHRDDAKSAKETVLVPDSGSKVIQVDNDANPDDRTVIPDSHPMSQVLATATLSDDFVARNSQTAKAKIQKAPRSVSNGNAPRNQKKGQDNHKTTQTKGIKKSSGKSIDVKENGTITREPPADDKKRKRDGKVLEKRRNPQSTGNAFNSTLYDLPEDGYEDIDAVETSALKSPPKKRGPGRPSRPSHDKSKAATRSTKMAKLPTAHLSQKEGMDREDDSSEDSDGPDDSNDGDYHDGTTLSAPPPAQRKTRSQKDKVGESRAKKETSRTRAQSKLREQKSQELTEDNGGGIPRPINAELGNKTRLDDELPERSQVPDSDVYSAQSRPGPQPQRSELLEHSTSDHSDEAQLAPQKDHRGGSDMKRQESKIFDESSGDFDSNEDEMEAIDTIPAHTEQTTNAEAKPGAVSESLKEVEQPDGMHVEATAINSDREKLLPESASPSTAIIDPAVISIAEGTMALKPHADAANVATTLGQDEQLETGTNQPDEAHSKVVKKRTPGNIWQPNAFAKKPLGCRSQPDPSKSVFVVKKALRNIDAANDAREIEEAEETYDNTNEPLFNEHRHRKPNIVPWDRTGPLAQGKTPPGSQLAPKGHQDQHSQADTSFLTKGHTSSRKVPAMRAAMKTYGARSSKTRQEHPSFGEMLQGPDERNAPREENVQGKSRAIEGPDLGPSIENAVASQGLDFEDELTILPETGITPSAPSYMESSQGIKKPVIEIKVEKKVRPSSSSESYGESDLANGPTYYPPPRTEPYVPSKIGHPQGIKSLAVEVVETNTENSASESDGESEFADELTHHQSTEAGKYFPSKSGLSPRHLDGKPASVASPVEATVSHFGPTPSATVDAKRRRDDPAEETVRLLRRDLFPGRHDVAQAATYHAEVTKQSDIRRGPSKRMKFDDQLSNPHEEIPRRLSVVKKSEATAPSSSVVPQAATLQRRMSRRISDDGSPEPCDDVERPVFNITSGGEARPRAQLNQSPALTRVRMASSPFYSRGTLSSNRKKLPDPPLASSKAITSHAPEHMLEQSKLLNTPAQPEADPFSSPEISKKKESKFVAMLREKSETQDFKRVDGKSDRKTPGLEALINARDDDDDPDTTLVNDDDLGDLPDYDSDMSNASTLDEDEDEEEDEVLQLKNLHRSESDWDASLKPHQQGYSLALSRISQRLVRYLVDQETAIEDVVAAFEHDGNHLIEEMERAHKEEYELERGAVRKTKTKLKSMLERMNDELRSNRQLYEARRQKLRHEAEYSSRASDGLKEQIGVLEAMMTEFQG